MVTKKQTAPTPETRKAKGEWGDKRSVAGTDLAGKTKVSSAKVAMAFERASRSTGAFTSKYAK